MRQILLLSLVDAPVSLWCAVWHDGFRTFLSQSGSDAPGPNVACDYDCEIHLLLLLSSFRWCEDVPDACESSFRMHAASNARTYVQGNYRGSHPETSGYDARLQKSKQIIANDRRVFSRSDSGTWKRKRSGLSSAIRQNEQRLHVFKSGLECGIAAARLGWRQLRLSNLIDLIVALKWNRLYRLGMSRFNLFSINAAVLACRWWYCFCSLEVAFLAWVCREMLCGGAVVG